MEQDQLLPAASWQNFPIPKPSSKHQAAKQGVHFILDTTKQPADSQQTEMLLTYGNANVKLAPAWQFQVQGSNAHLFLPPVSNTQLTERSIRGDPTKPPIRPLSTRPVLGGESDHDSLLLEPDFTVRAQSAMNANRDDRCANPLNLFRPIHDPTLPKSRKLKIHRKM